jgi:cytoskeletal protein RodZ
MPLHAGFEKITPILQAAKLQTIAFSKEVDIGSRKENASKNKSLITSNETTAAEARSNISSPSEAAAITIAPTTAESACAGTADEAAAAEIDFGQFAGVLPTQVIQNGVDALMVALNRCARAVQL